MFQKSVGQTIEAIVAICWRLSGDFRGNDADHIYDDTAPVRDYWDIIGDTI